MNNYKKDKGYIKQRLEYVSPVDYISELEEQIEDLQNENIFLRSHQKLDETFFKWNLEDASKEIETLNNKLEKIKEIINYYAVEDEDYSKIYNDEEKELLKVVEGDE